MKFLQSTAQSLGVAFGETSAKFGIRTFGRASAHAACATALIALALLVCIPIVRAQKDAGAIVGVVKDSSGEKVPAAKVTARDTDRRETVSTTTDEQGNYVFSPLRI